MKCEGFLVVIISLMTFFSCSMEDDPIMNNMDKPYENIVSGNDAVVSANVYLSSLLTKSTSFGKGGQDSIVDQKIKNAVVFLLNGESIESVKSHTFTDETSYNLSFYTKAGENKFLYAVTNVTDATIASLEACKNLASIKTVKLTKEDLALAPKVSESVVGIDFKTFKESPDQTLYNEDPIKIEVTQRTARIELAAVDYTFAANVVEYTNVELTSVSLRHQVVTGGLVDGLYPSYEGQTWSGKISKDNSNKSFKVSDVFFRTFANNNIEKKTALALQFKVNGKLSSLEVPLKEYTIKTPAQNGYTETVESNHIYRLTIHAIVSSGDIEISVKGNVEDWNKNTVVLDPIWGEDSK